jgi:outer membrane immunogenic protein
MENQGVQLATQLLARVVSLLFASFLAGLQASAADLTPPASLKDGPELFAPPAFWPGFYIGGHAGAAFGDTGVNDGFTYVGDPSFNGSLGSVGFIGGAQAGYNVQRDHIVFGLEGDIGYLGIPASKTVSFNPGSCVGHYSDGSTVPYTGTICDIDGKYSSSTDLYGDLTGRLGYAVDRTLFYAKGGVAFLNAGFKANYAGQSCKTLNTCGAGGPSTFNYDHSDTLAGWTLGAGVEYALTPSWSLKAEYQHFDFGTISYTYFGCVSLGGACPGSPGLPGHYTSTLYGRTDVSLAADAVILGVNYHINEGRY